eukprot:scaffold82382_cov72-Phaeocystis_antarctica.AAC.8
MAQVVDAGGVARVQVCARLLGRAELTHREEAVAGRRVAHRVCGGHEHVVGLGRVLAALGRGDVGHDALVEGTQLRTEAHLERRRHAVGKERGGQQREAACERRGVRQLAQHALAIHLEHTRPAALLLDRRRIDPWAGGDEAGLDAVLLGRGEGGEQVEPVSLLDVRSARPAGAKASGAGRELNRPLPRALRLPRLPTLRRPRLGERPGPSRTLGGAALGSAAPAEARPAEARPCPWPPCCAACDPLRCVPSSGSATSPPKSRPTRAEHLCAVSACTSALAVPSSEAREKPLPPPSSLGCTRSCLRAPASQARPAAPSAARARRRACRAAVSLAAPAPGSRSRSRAPMPERR